MNVRVIEWNREVHCPEHIATALDDAPDDFKGTTLTLEGTDDPCIHCPPKRWDRDTCGVCGGRGHTTTQCPQLSTGRESSSGPGAAVPFGDEEVPL